MTAGKTGIRMRMPTGPQRPLACLVALALLPHMAQARPLLRQQDPARTLALSADADGDGFVTKAEIADAAAKAVVDAPKEFEVDWAIKLAVYGLPPDAKALDVRAVYETSARILDAADADHDGSVTPSELRSYVEGFPVERRPDMVESALALDRDADMVVTKAERDIAAKVFAKETARSEALPAPEREKALHPPKDEALATWKASTERVAFAAVALWREVAKDGRASLDDLGEPTPDAP